MPPSLSDRRTPRHTVSPGQPVKPDTLRCQEAGFESLWVIIRAMAGFLAHNDDWHPVSARFARFVPPGRAEPGGEGSPAAQAYYELMLPSRDRSAPEESAPEES